MSRKENDWQSGTNVTTFETLPSDVILYILCFLSPKKYLEVQVVSTRFLDFCTDFDELLWLPVIRSQSPSLFEHISKNSTPVHSWKAAYFFLETTTSYTSQIKEIHEHITGQFISRNQVLRQERDVALDENEKSRKELEHLKSFK